MGRLKRWRAGTGRLRGLRSARAVSRGCSWSGVLVVQSVRFSRELTERLMTEAARRGCTPSEVIRDLVEAGLAAVDESATVKLADVRRGLEGPGPGGGGGGG